ncbi:MAG: hypothetical protein ACREFQ_14485, partial [Stellaceae bacterium]
MDDKEGRTAIPSIERLLTRADVAPLIGEYGRPAVVDAVRTVLDILRRAWSEGGPDAAAAGAVIAEAANRLAEAARPSLRPVFNLTGTVLHTNLGRALLPEAAVAAAAEAARSPVNLEYELGAGRRGERDLHVERLLTR